MPRGSVPGTAVVNINQLKPVACIVAFKHIHSGTVPTDPNFWGNNPVVPVVNDYDPREQALYPPAPALHHSHLGRQKNRWKPRSKLDRAALAECWVTG